MIATLYLLWFNCAKISSFDEFLFTRSRLATYRLHLRKPKLVQNLRLTHLGNRYFIFICSTPSRLNLATNSCSRVLYSINRRGCELLVRSTGVMDVVSHHVTAILLGTTVACDSAHAMTGVHRNYREFYVLTMPFDVVFKFLPLDQLQG
jgi:hypothetical protein